MQWTLTLNLNHTSKISYIVIRGVFWGTPSLISTYIKLMGLYIYFGMYDIACPFPKDFLKFRP